MNITLGDYVNGTYTQTINISSNATKLYYNLSVSDTGSNWVNTVIKDLNVIDNDPPYIIDITAEIPKTGDDFNFTVNINDNIDVSNSYIEYWFDDQIKYNKTLDNKLNNYMKTIQVPLWSTSLSYIISAKDTSDNWANLQTKVVDILDNKKPIIIDNSGTPTTGDPYLFIFNSSDNIEISSKSIEYWFDEEDHENAYLNKKNEYEITIPENVYILNYKITIIDSSGNILQISKSKSIIDNDTPIIIDNTYGKPKTGKTFRIEFSIIENRDIGNITLNYWYNNQNKINHSFFINSFGQYNYSIRIPQNQKVLNYEINAIDLSNNIAQMNKSLSIFDTIPPIITDLTDGFPTTGDEFNITFVVDENIELKSFSIEYWFDDKTDVEVSNDIEVKFTVPLTSRFLFYDATAQDSAGNKQNLKNKLSIIDNDHPSIVVNTNSPTTGDNFKMDIIIEDNINISTSYLLFSNRNNQNFSNITLKSGKNEYSIILPNTSKTVQYMIFAIDGSNNHLSINKTLMVLDNDQPTIDDYSLNYSTTGDIYKLNMRFNDNIQLSMAIFEYDLNNTSFTTLMDSPEWFYFLDIPIQNNATKLNYSITVKDISNNSRTIEKSIPIYDNDPPQISDNSNQNGSLFYFIVVGKDNFGIKSGSVHYCINNGSYFDIPLDFDGIAYYNYVKLPNNASNISYSISMTDYSNNTELIPFTFVELEFYDGTPTKEPGFPYWLILIIVIFIIIPFVLFYYYKKKKKDVLKE
jgi:hypothetical protein